jgi:hypothetical protein
MTALTKGSLQYPPLEPQLKQRGLQLLPSALKAPLTAEHVKEDSNVSYE